MALSKVTYVDGVTIIGAKNLNDIQDELIRQGEQQTEDEESMEAALALKADKSTTYTKTEVDSALALKADKSDTYTKAQVDASLALKADKSDTYTKAEVDASLELKADKTETYTKAQVDSIVEDAIAEAVKESEYSNFEMKSVSGDFVHITDGAGLIPVKDLKIGIDAVQDLHGYDAPWVGGAGKNKAELVDPQLTTNVAQRVATLNYTGTFDITISFDLVGAKYTETGGASLFNLHGDSNHFVVPSSIYKIDGSTTIQANTEYTGRFYYTWTNVENPQYINMYFESASYGKWSGQMKNIQVEIGSLTDYAPYENICPISGWTGANIYVSPTADEEDATVYSVTWEDEAGTVYGGVLDVTTGELVVTHGFADLGDLSWRLANNEKFFYASVPNGKLAPSGTIKANIICSQYVTDTGGNVYGGVTNGTIAMSNGSSEIWVCDKAYSDASTFKTAMDGVQLVYELATPQTYQLTPTEVLTLLGENNIFADTGAVEELIYRISRQ